MKKKLSLILTFVLIMGVMSGCGGVKDKKKASDDVITVKIAHTDSSSRSTHKWAEWLGEYLEKEAPGRFKVEVYSDGSLGDTPDAIAGLGLGTVQIVFDLSSAFTQIAGNKSACIDLPYLYPTYDEWIEGTFKNGGLELFNETIADADFYCIDMYYNGMRQLISRDKIYHNTDDLKGQKIRIAQNDLNVEIWNSLGANPTPMAWGEVVTSLSQGQINALDHSLGVFNDFNLFEIAPYVTLTNHASSPFPIICDKKWIESLDKEDRKILEDGVHKMAKSQRDEERKNESEYIKRFKDGNAKVYELTDDELKAFEKASEPVYKWMRSKAGDEIVDKWLATKPKK